MRNSLQPIDKIAIALIILLTLVMVLLVSLGNACGNNCLFNTGARVSNFSWENKTIGGEDQAFLLTFNRPMDRTTVEKNLVVKPPLPGKISWSGLRLAYTLKTPAPYGETYQVSLTQARDKFAAGNKQGQIMQPFVEKFYTRDRALVYIGSQGEENGRLVLFNWTQQRKTILTPNNLIVFDFESYPKGDRLLFSAANKDSGVDGIRTLQLYTVTTGVDHDQTNNFQPQLKLVLDNQKYQNNKFDLSQDGQTIVVQRISPDNTSEFGLWAISENKPPEPLNNSPGGDFLITPDSQAVAVAQGEGIALLPLQPNAKPIDFLPKFGQVLSFSADGSGAAMINYNTDNPKLRYTRSLFYVNNQGIQKELLNIKGSIIDCQFNPTATSLYCLLTKPEIIGEEYLEKPYIAEIDLTTAKTTNLLSLSKYQDSKISIAPDGLSILFNQISSSDSETASSLWLLIPSSSNSSNSAVYHAEPLPFIGFNPQWLP